MKQKLDVPGQLALFNIASVEVSERQHDPYWDEIETAPQHSDKKDLRHSPWDEWELRVRAQISPSTTVESCVGAQVSLVTEKSAPQHSDDDRWNPADFGEVPRLADGDQLTIFYDDSSEPPDPDDYQNLDDYNCAWREWQLRVGAQVVKGTTVKSCVGAQVLDITEKVAPQHDTHWIEKYWVERSGNKYWYYRYCWMTGRKKNRRYLGSVNSKLAKRKKADIEVWISDGYSSSEIVKLIQCWGESWGVGSGEIGR
ncbi:hypothetical protein FACHB389_34760 [Nostoc calcicola FACHB-389]|nr:hypothetical protein FACHB389_34760 [Nostoc calcicola FACHB-389]